MSSDRIIETFSNPYILNRFEGNFVRGLNSNLEQLQTINQELLDEIYIHISHDNNSDNKH